MINSRVENDRREWGKVLAQITCYMATFGSRYGFIITDAHLIVLRISRLRTSRLRTDDGFVSGRPHRFDIFYATNYSADEDSSFANTTASYVDDNPVNWEMEPPEYAVIPWAEHRPGKLTVKLALWSLAMMAANGGRDIDYSYPALDSGRQEGSKYVHNTSGATKKRLRRHDRMEGLDPVGATVGTVAPSLDVSERYSEEDVGESSGSGGVVIQGSGEVGNDVAYFSQAGTAAPDEDEGVPGTFRQEHDDEKEEDDADDGDEIETVIPALKRVTVAIKKRRITRGLYYIDTKGREIKTDRSEWRKVHNGYELQGRRHTYFTKSFPI